MRRLLVSLSIALAVAAVVAPRPVLGQEPAAPQVVVDDDKANARALYLQGVALVKAFQWSEALGAFEKSYKLVPNAVTSLNIGSCERALGRYVRARSTLARALEENTAAGGAALAESSVAEAKGFLAEIDKLVAHATVTITPREAAIAVDGRPLATQFTSSPLSRLESTSSPLSRLESTGGGAPVLAAGVLPPGPGAAPPAATFHLVVDPGAHVITLTRKGFSDVVVNKSFAPGSHTELALALDLLPATLKITASQPGSIVRVGDRDVGPAPIDVLRPGGNYRVIVEKAGFVPYETQVSVRPGEELKLSARMVEDKPSVLTRWWFWTGAAVVVGAGIAITYAATRPEPQPPPYDGGSTGWVVEPAGFRF